MKLLKVIWEHTKGARASYLLLAVMMTFSLFVTVMLFGYLNCMRSCYDILRNKILEIYKPIKKVCRN